MTEIVLPKVRNAGVKPLFTGPEWNFELLREAYDAIAEVGLGEMGLDIYKNQIEVITSEQMLDAYSSIGMPMMYRHWSFGKRFAQDESAYRKGYRSLAFEIVINSDPCINYIMEENTMTMQALVMAHAALGHNHFFKNNYLFRQWTRADMILEYLAFAKRFVTECEERFGVPAVESVLDAAHAIMNQGVSRHARARRRPDPGRDRDREIRRREHEEQTYNELWRTLPVYADTKPEEKDKEKPEGSAEERRRLALPEENLLYFLEKNAPKAEGWKRELLRIVRNLSQYFYPQRQTKVMNEGCATFVHYEIMNRLYERGRITDGSMLEFLHMHAAVVNQPGFSDRNFGGINPYALGFAMMRDIQRICENPTDEDYAWFPDFAGNRDAMGTLRTAWADYRDESFILQYLSPKVMRDFRLFAIRDNAEAPTVRVEAIHDERGYKDVRRRLARNYDISVIDPDIQVTDADLAGSRRLVLTHYVRNGILLDKEECDRTLMHVARLWGYRVRLVEVDAQSGKRLREHETLPMP
ncbi:MAG TPA: SpoVR family protein [Hyphomicrobiaceae bacterium]|nr:SpoVR family protein [Hyphomicrobiaceae bacterium]